MRCAVAEAVIAQGLSRHIFQDFYCLEEVAGVEAAALTKAVERLGKDYRLEATIIRCQLAKAGNQSRGVEEIPAQAAKSACALLSDWLNDDVKRKQQFLAELTDLYSGAMDLWQNFQQHSKRVRSIVDLVDGSNAAQKIWVKEEDSRPEYDNVPLGEEQPAGAVPFTGPLAVLFPQIRVDNNMLFHGYALFYDQNAVIVATRERNNLQSSLTASSNQRRAAWDDGPGDHIDQQAKAAQRLSSLGEGLHQRQSALGVSSDVSYSGISSLH